jgi:hypothetical protein
MSQVRRIVFCSPLMRRAVATFLTAAAFFTIAPSARADEITVSAAALVGYGITSHLVCGPTDETCNPFGVGIGVRAGVTLPFHLYLGGTLVYQIGYSKDFGNGDTASAHVFYPGIEGGYDFVFGPITLRPYLGVGDAFVTSSGTLPAVPSEQLSSSAYDINQHRFAVWPGAVGYVSFNRFFAGLDARYFFTNDGGSTAPCFFGTFGVKIY